MRLISEAVHVLAALRIADLLAAGPKSTQELGHATGVNASSLRREMRALVRSRIFTQDSAGRFALAARGELADRQSS